MQVKLLYFAWVREKAGLGEEVVELPGEVNTVADLVRWQRGRAPQYADAFANADIIRVALDQQHAPPSSSLEGAREIAFFPPVTGG